MYNDCSMYSYIGKKCIQFNIQFYHNCDIISNDLELQSIRGHDKGGLNDTQFTNEITVLSPHFYMQMFFLI